MTRSRVLSGGRDSVGSTEWWGAGKDGEVLASLGEWSEQMRQDAQIYVDVFQPEYRLRCIFF